jgi:hypothetical protein
MNILRALTVLVLLYGGNALLPSHVFAQEINFDQINKFESLGTGTLRVGAPPKTIIDDGERHVVILTIWDADAETKVYWRSACSVQVFELKRRRGMPSLRDLHWLAAARSARVRDGGN